MRGSPTVQNFISRYANHIALILSLSWVLLVSILLGLFTYLDWGHGIARFFILCAIWICCVIFSRAFKRLKTEMVTSPLTSLGILIIVGCMFLLNARVGLLSIQEARKTEQVKSDQAQSAYRAILHVKQGINPYGRNTVLDPPEFFVIAPKINENDCGSYDIDRGAEVLNQYWSSLSIGDMMKIFPNIPDIPQCQDIKRRFSSLGFKYGPMLLLNYWPFTNGFKEPGVLINHFVLFLTFSAVMALWLYKRSQSLFLTSMGLIPIFMPAHLRWNILTQGHSDLLPTFLSIVFLILWVKKKDGLAAIILALGVAAKTFPGLIYLPLLFRKPRSIYVFLISIGVLYLPFLFWDRIGLWNNLSYPFLTHDADSTSFRYFLPSWGAKLLPIIFFGSAFYLYQAIKNEWELNKIMPYLLFTHLAIFANGNMFHNNYLVWVLPVVSLFVFERILSHQKSYKEESQSQTPA